MEKLSSGKCTTSDFKIFSKSAEERSVFSDSTIKLNIIERAKCTVRTVIVPKRDTRVMLARAKDRAFGASLGVFITHVPRGMRA